VLSGLENGRVDRLEPLAISKLALAVGEAKDSMHGVCSAQLRPEPAIPIRHVPARQYQQRLHFAVQLAHHRSRSRSTDGLPQAARFADARVAMMRSWNDWS
jgi:hypothetical protein